MRSSPPADARESSHTRSKARILIVDDEPELREVLADALAPLNVEVFSAASGAEAIALAQAQEPDLLIADVRLGDGSGLDVIDRVRSVHQNVSAVVITGFPDPHTLTSASRCRPVELMTKPLDLQRLRRTVQDELARRAARGRQTQRTRRLRLLARKTNIERKTVSRQLETACAELAGGYRSLSRQLAAQNVVVGYQQKLLAAQTDDDVFRAFFQTFARHSGPIFGAALLCDTEAQLHLIGRFGVPQPDSAAFCRALAGPVVEQTLQQGRQLLVDAGQDAAMFDASLHRYLPGLTVLSVPLLPVPDELIGVIVLYRKGEQPISDLDLSLAEMMSTPTAAAVQRND
jgi:DNA-binding response OmpR family regulator